MTEDQWKAFDSYPKGLVVDPADRKPFAMAWFAITPRDHYIIFEEWPKGEFVRMKSSDKGVADYVSIIRAIEAGDNHLERPITNVIWRIMDPSFGKSKSAATGRTLQDDFSVQGIWFDCTVQNDIPSGHLAVKERLKDPPTLFFTPNCKNAIQAMLRYAHDEYRRDEPLRTKEKPKEDYKDFADVVRYLVMYDPWYFVPGAAVGNTLEIPRNMGLG